MSTHNPHALWITHEGDALERVLEGLRATPEGRAAEVLTRQDPRKGWLGRMLATLATPADTLPSGVMPLDHAMKFRTLPDNFN